MIVVRGEHVARFVGEKVGRSIYPPYEAVGLEKDGEVVAGVIFNSFTGSDVHATIAGQGWTRGFLADIGDYLFNKLKVARVTAITEQPNVVRLAERLGGKVEGRLRDQFGPGRDGYVVGILKSEWKF